LKQDENQTVEESVLLLEARLVSSDKEPSFDSLPTRVAGRSRWITNS
jgi:hypothetical protein